MTKPIQSKDPRIVACRKGGFARSRKMTPAERSESASKAARARWAKADDLPWIHRPIPLVDGVVHVVSAAIFRGPTHAPELLLTQRDERSDFAGCWELPGGKMAPKETPGEAIVRELDEEAGIRIESVSIEPIFVWDIETTKRFRVHFVACVWKQQKIVLNEVQGAGWFKFPLPVGLPMVPSLIAGHQALLEFGMSVGSRSNMTFSNPIGGKGKPCDAEDHGCVRCSWRIRP